MRLYDINILNKTILRLQLLLICKKLDDNFNTNRETIKLQIKVIKN